MERIPWVAGAAKFTFAFALVLVLVASTLAQSQTFKVVHNFAGGGNGANPVSGLIADAAGNLYGTASSAGEFNDGLVFKLSRTGQWTSLHVFKGGSKDGATPEGLLLRDRAGNLYGTTYAGGLSGNGTVFELVGGTKEVVLYSFRGDPDGANPIAGLTFDAYGNLYGTTSAGGANGTGAVFELAAPKKSGGAWTESVLYSFGGTDGATPYAGVTFDAAGNLYGTTAAGGAYTFGTVFELTPGTPWTETKLWDFQNATDGAVPYAGLTADQSGNFYGATTEGGDYNSNGGGTIFELSPSNGTWKFSVIYGLPGWGISGSFRNVVLDPATGNIYGTTHCDGNYNSGTLYELTPSGGTWNYSLLYTFTGGQDGQYSFSNLVLNQGKLYGTTKYGGANHNGVIFSITP
jgi:uncharacterized repeat protein (TIGR03803 family)